MARINNKKDFQGAIGNVIFRTVAGKQLIQTKPERLKHTEATKISASEFRKCSTWARQLRMSLTPFLVGLTDSYMYRRFTGAFYKALQANTAIPKGERTPLTADMAGLAGFDYNTNSPFLEYFSTPISASIDDQRQITISIPAFDIPTAMRFPEHTHKAELLLYVYATGFEANATNSEDYMMLPLDAYNTNSVAINWTSQPMPEGRFIVVCAKLMYYNTNKFSTKNYTNSTQLNPAMIINALRS